MHHLIRKLSFVVLIYLAVAVPSPSFSDDHKAGAQVIAAPSRDEAVTAGALAVQPHPQTRFVVDDSTYDLAVGLVDPTTSTAYQAVVVNYFEPTTNTLPLDIQTVEIFLPETSKAGPTGLRTGMPFEVLVYLDTAGTGDPRNAILASRQTFEATPSNERFQIVTLDHPVTVSTGGVWIGYTNTVSATDRAPIFFAALDTSGGPRALSSGRSWIFYNRDANFPGLSLASAEVQHLVDKEGIPGNWMIHIGGNLSGADTPAPTVDTNPVVGGTLRDTP